MQNVVQFLDFNSVAYDFAGALGQVVRFKQGTDLGSNLILNNLNSAADKLLSGTIGTSAWSFNSSISIESTAGITVSQGDSPLIFSILYREITF